MDTYLILLDGKMERIYLKDFPGISQESVDHFLKCLLHIFDQM